MTLADAQHRPPARSEHESDTGSTDPGAPSRSFVRRPRRPRPAQVLLGVAERWALLGLLLGVCVFFSLYPPSSSVFPTAANLGVITGNQSVTAVVALAVLFPLVCGHFDFSLGATASLTSVLCAALMSRHGAPLWVAVVAAVALGALIGAVNGALIAFYHTNAFITTLGAATLIGGLISWYSHSQSISTGISTALTTFGGSTWLGLPQLVYLVAVMVVLAWYLLTQTTFGRALAAIGSNPRAARLVGLRVDRDTFAAFVLAGALAGVAGVLTTARTGGSTTDTGTTVLFGALAAVFLGLTAVTPGRFNVIGTVIGLSFVTASVSGLTLSGASDWVQPVFDGAALVLAVILSTYLARRRRGAEAL